MKESNIFFATNTFKYGSEYTGSASNKFNESKGNTAFFRQVIDYDALMKLRSSPKMRGSLNSNYYMAHISQIRVLDPEFSSVMLGRRKIDPDILEENARYDAEYGYPEKNDYYPLLEQIIIDNRELNYADELLGKWVQADKGLDASASDTFGLFIKQKVKIDTSNKIIKPEDTGFKDIEDTDPYYYIYEEAAGKTKRALGNLDTAKLYEEMYGSIFRAFSAVSQEEIIQAPVAQCTFVDAGPGTGKTYTLLKKIIYMIECQGTDPEEILVLCFTNAAVNEIKARIKKYAETEGDRNLVNVDVRTFHSFSWLLISQANELFCDRPNYQYIDISQFMNDFNGYARSIRKATEIIHKFGDEVFSGCAHLIVDEVQDLTNEKAYLVMTIVRECMKNGTGVTLLGDSCQAIYDYSEEGALADLKSERFYKHIFSDLYERGKFYKLENNHRQSDTLIKITLPLRLSILEGKKDKVREDIIELKQNVPRITTGAVSIKLSEYDFARMTEAGTVCLMCRNNAQVLVTSANLRKKGIQHIVNAYKEFEYLAGWIGKIFCLFAKEAITFNEFSNIVKRRNIDILPEAIWERLQELIGSQNNVLKVFDILKSAAQSKVDDPIFRNSPKGKLIVSNIHKSKGREYDTVVVEQSFVDRLINNSTSIKSVQEYLEEAKILYVAVTRPKSRLYFNNLAATNVSFIQIYKTGRKRWVRGDGSNLKRIEVRALSDFDITSCKTTDLQEYIVNNVVDGDEIKLVLDTNARSVTYNIMHTTEKGDRVIGKTTSEFIDDVDAIISPYKSPWPKRITNLYVSGIYSQISNDFSEVWCWVDFCGIGTADTDTY